ncbi:MAG TPA: metabolite traffic protein EboE [bacterium]|nr:metabolite traffic protein EboE [bacterium]
MQVEGPFHLTYCSNIHAGESWAEVRANLGTYLPAVRERVGAEGPFGIGLRLSARAAEELEVPEALAEFQEFLAREGFYVFTINGFPYGVFHRARVKEEVYLPDWKDEERLAYSNRLAELLAALLPDWPGLEGSVSTVPGAFKGEVGDPADVERMAVLLLRHVEALHRLRERTGKTITLALEPEPCCFIETCAEAIDFFREHLFAGPALEGLAQALELDVADARKVVRRHLGVCYDACHMAVEFEDMGASLRALDAAEIKICKVQISSALKLRFQRGDGRARSLLAPFAESTYLHQVVERSPAGLTRFTDLPEGFAAEAQAATEKRGEPVEWRVHFHVPVFLEEMQHFETTQTHLAELLHLLRDDPARCPYLEVETYTWDVLPAEYRDMELPAAISRELDWVREQLRR